jgi:hypothetical protein
MPSQAQTHACEGMGSAMSVTYEQFLTLFPQSPREKSGKGVRVLCPAHNDRNPSLWVEPPSDGFTVDFKCLAGCKREAILDALKLTWADVRRDGGKSEPAEWRVTDSFVYQLEPGKEYYVIDRQENGAKKKFVAKHKSNGDYIFNLDGLTPILYKLPELRQAVSSGRTILLPEGEGKVNRLRELGFEATTNPFGAGKWNDTYTKEFAGADVVIPPDYDKPGMDFTEQKARALHGTAKRVRILHLTDIETLKKSTGKDGADIINWLDAGHTKEELQSLIDSAPEWTPPQEDKTKFTLTLLAQLLAEPEEITSWLWDKTLPRAGLSLLVSKPKVGKTTLVRNLALKVAGGKLFLGRGTTSGPVVYLALEEKRAEVAAHFLRMGANDEKILIHTGSAPKEAIAALKVAITQSGAVLAIVDPLFRMVRIKDGNDYAEVTRALEPLLMLARETGCHILTVHHSVKGDREGGDGILGSTALFGSVDTALVMRRRETERTLESIQRYGVNIPRMLLTFDPETGLIDAAGTVDELETQRLREEILQTLEDGKLTETEIRDAIGGNTGLVGKALRKLLADHEVEREGSGRRGDPFRYQKILVSRFSYSDKREKQVNGETPGDDPVPKIDDTLNPDVDCLEAVFGMPVKKAIEIWHKEGAPLIHLGPGENCEDLAKLLSNPDINERHLQAVQAWLDEVLKRRGEA